MGLISAGIGALGGTLADQWKEFFYCDSLTADTLVVKGQKRTSGRSSNTKGEDNIISKGSVVAVADGQCMIIVDQGKVAEVCAEPGQFVYDSSTEPSIFAGSLGTSILDTFKEIGRRFTFGGDTGRDQRVYYFNTKEITGNKFGTANPVMFRVVDSRINLDIDVSLRCNGTYTYRLADPIRFYTNISGNVEKAYTRSMIDADMKVEFLSALQPALAKLSALELRPNEILAHTTDLEKAINEVLSEDWGKRRGIVVEKISLGSVTLPDEDAELIKTAQRTAMYRDPGMAAATMTDATATAMKDAANNQGGAAMAFMNMNTAANMNAANTAALYQMAAQQQAQQQAAQQQQAQQQQAPAAAPAKDTWVCPTCGKEASGKFCPECGTKKPEPKPANSWKCPTCGKDVTGKFCPECGTKKPVETSADGWTCPDCGTVNKGRFCSNCGTKKPEGVPLYRCDQCGWEPEDPAHPPKFCPECGDPFDESDRK